MWIFLKEDPSRFVRLAISQELFNPVEINVDALSGHFERILYTFDNRSFVGTSSMNRLKSEIFPELTDAM